MILGHEAVGQIVEVGALVKDFKPGDRVIVPCHNPRLGRAGIPGRLFHALRRYAGRLEVFQLQGWRLWRTASMLTRQMANLALLPDDVDMAAARAC